VVGEPAAVVGDVEVVGEAGGTSARSASASAVGEAGPVVGAGSDSQAIINAAVIRARAAIKPNLMTIDVWLIQVSRRWREYRRDKTPSTHINWMI
jgi:hypothetical protein